MFDFLDELRTLITERLNCVPLFKADLTSLEIAELEQDTFEELEKLFDKKPGFSLIGLSEIELRNELDKARAYIDICIIARGIRLNKPPEKLGLTKEVYDLHKNKLLEASRGTFEFWRCFIMTCTSGFKFQESKALWGRVTSFSTRKQIVI